MKSLAVKYRPNSFEEVSGQNYTIDILKAQIENKDIKNCYLFSGASGCGKALHPTRTFLYRQSKDTKDVYKIYLDQVEVGDKILCPNGNFEKVLGKYKQEKSYSYRICLSDYSIINSDAGHLWNVYFNRSKILRTVSTEYLLQKFESGNIIQLERMEKPYSGVYLNRPDSFYKIFGIFYRYGYKKVDAEQNELTLKIPSDNPNKFFIELDNLLKQYYIDFSISVGNNKHIYNLRAKHTDSILHYFDFFIFKGYTGLSSDKIPHFWNLSYENKLDFLRGFFFFNKNLKRRYLTFTTTSIDLINSFKYLIASLCGRISIAKVYENNNINNTGNTCFRVSVYLSKEILKELDFKHYIYKKEHNLHLRIKDIKVTKEQVEHICLSVDNSDKTFIINSFIPTHNTTVARIFGNKLNSGAENSIIEIDAASNNGVDDIRNIIKEAYFNSMNGQYKIFIIDECHSISSQGWQAFLKTLEEPPANTIFIFCTTEPHKIPLTIQNRLQHFVFNRMSAETIYKRLMEILKKENLTNKISKEAINYIAKVAKGGMRDGIAYMDKVLSYKENNIDSKDVARILNISDYDNLIELIKNVNDKKVVLEIINKVYSGGVELKGFINDLIKFVIELIKSSIIGIEETDIPIDYKTDIENINPNKNYSFLQDLLVKLIDLKSKIIYENYSKPFIEAFFIGISDDRTEE